MPHVFVSYARPDEPLAQLVAEELRTAGFEVWRDDELPAHRPYAEVIEERVNGARAVVVLWSAEAAKSHWVRAEADTARAAMTLVQVTLDGTLPPMPFNQIQCADLNGWDGDSDASGWRKLAASVSALAGLAGKTDGGRQPRRRQLSICVLPFANMSGDAEQEYFSDGISEDITTDLSNVSALEVVARNTAFTFKDKSVDVCDVARKLGVSHVLEGSVRKAGNRVRITAQLIDGHGGGHLWAERFDRDLTDIFAIQDEISKAIVAALKLKLLPEEKKAIEQRGTSSPEAYDLYLMARQLWVTGNSGDPRREEMIVRTCQRAIDIDSRYARAWALMALAQVQLQFRYGRSEIDGVAAAEKALYLNPNIAEAHSVKARLLAETAHDDEANAEIEMALRLDPASWEVNKEAALLVFRQGRIADAKRHWKQAVSVMPTDYHSWTMLVTCYRALGEVEEMVHAARMTLEQAERVLAEDSSNAAARGQGAAALAYVGDSERAKQWFNRAVLMDPDNVIMRYNFACALIAGGDLDGGIEEIAPFLAKSRLADVHHVEVDPDMDPLRDNPRFQKMLADAKARTASEK